MISKLKKINLKSIYFNFKYLPFKQALKLPILISNNVYLLKAKGKIQIQGKLQTGLIKIGFGEVGIFDSKRSRTIWEVQGEVIFKGKANIGHGSKICVGPTGVLELGNNFKISAESTIVAFKEVEIGNDCLLSWQILIMDTDFHKIVDVNTGSLLNPDKKITISDKVWIGCRCLILKGANIPSNSIIAANSIVTKKIEGANNIYGGDPISVLKENVTWSL